MQHCIAAPTDLLPRVEAAVAEAAALIRAEFHRPGGPRRSSPGKAPIDVEVETSLRALLQRIHPADWIGEETGRQPATGDACWIVDPQDGTADVLKGLRGSAVPVALLREGRPVLGIVCAPTAPDDVLTLAEALLAAGS
jgi:fructose-1,6-bisphosphatase/inositol monophosphatase family enzyme